MKIIVILDNEIGVGGGFNQALNAILQIQRLCKDRFAYEVFTKQNGNLPYLQTLGIDAHIFSYSILDRLMAKLSLNGWWQSLQSRIKLVGPFEKKLLRHSCDLVYFVTQGSSMSAALQKLNYISTVMDLCHRDAPEFPEVRDFCTLFIRERYFQHNIAPAVLVLTDSEQSADFASLCYGVDRARFLPMPFAPSPFVDQIQAHGKETVLKKYGMAEGYFFYPAQFWAHKNHIRILQALLILQTRGWTPRVVFSGKDCGNLGYVKEFAVRKGLSDRVRVLGFVPAEDMRGLYEGALAIIMPTYFGPTNLPPLEAWSLGKPLIYSSHLAGQAGSAALLVNPDDANELAEAMFACNDPMEKRRLIDAGKRRLACITEERSAAESELLKKLEEFAARRSCWE